MTRASLPPGFRFHPTDTELILYYLKRKVLGKPLCIQAVAEIDLYKFAPWDLPDKSCLRSSDLEWYFFCPKDRKYASGARVNRSTEIGHWKTTGKERTIYNGTQIVGFKKTLVFHLGRAPQGTRTNWVMHEYRIEIKDLVDAGISQDSYVLCKIFEKSGTGPKNGEQRGAPFKEEEWEDNLVDNSLTPLPLLDSGSPSVILDDTKINPTEGSTLLFRNTCDSTVQASCQNALPNACIEKPLPLEGANTDSLIAIVGENNDLCHKEKTSSLEAADMDSLLAILGEENDMGVSGSDANQISQSLNYECNDEDLLNGNDIYGGLEDLNTRTKLKGIGTLDLNIFDDNYGSSQTLLGDSITYMELNDFDCVMKYPSEVDGRNVFLYDNFGSRLEIGCSDSLGFRNSLSPDDNAFPKELNDNFSGKYPSLVKLNNVPSRGYTSLDHYDCVGDSSVPLVSSEVDHLASEVVSSQ